jgi:hypothetical protein
MRYTYLAMMMFFLAGVLVQVFLAGRAVMGVDAGSLDAHRDFGWPLAHMLAPLVFIASLFVGAGRGFLYTSIAWILCVVAVPILAGMASEATNAGESVPAVAGIHPLLAVIAFALTLWLAYRAWSLVQAHMTAPTPAPSPTGARKQA